MIFNAIHWNPDPEIINIFGFSLRYYGVLFAGGILLSAYLLGRIFKREGIPAENMDKLSIYVMIGILVGARLGHCLFYEPEYYLARPLEMLLPISFDSDGEFSFTGYRGLASHGGVLGMLIGLYFYSRKTGHALIDVFDLIAVVTGITLGSIRLGNFMNSEIIGSPTNSSWGVIFERVDDIARHPTQLYEAGAYFAICAFLLFLYYRYRPTMKHGLLFGIGLVVFFIARIVIEFFKENQVDFEEGMALNMGQLLSLPYIAVGIGFIIYGWRKSQASA